MEMIIILCVVALGFLLLKQLMNNYETKNKKAIKYIEEYVFPEKITNKLKQTYPHLEEKDFLIIIDGMKEYFKICSISGQTLVSMPSQAVDVAWHEFILFTKQYEEFCHKTLGRFLHHIPAEAMKSPTQAQEGIKRVWHFACLLENINPIEPNKLPLLFAIDSMLNIPKGFIYNLNSNPSKDKHVGDAGCGGY